MSHLRLLLALRNRNWSTRTRLLGRQERGGEKSIHTAREAEPPRREEGWALRIGVRFRIRIRIQIRVRVWAIVIELGFGIGLGLRGEYDAKRGLYRANALGVGEVSTCGRWCLGVH